MPTSRQRKTVKKASIKRGKYTRADVNKINAAFDKKFLEYSTYPLEQLETVLASKTERGTHLEALLRVIEAKKRPAPLVKEEKEPIDTLDDSEG